MVILACTFIIFAVLTFGVGPACIPGSAGSAVLRITLGIAASLVGTFLVGFLVYIADLPPIAAGTGLLAGGVICWLRRAALTEVWRDRTAQRFALLWSAVAAGLCAWSFTIINFSGGGWAGDWAEHFERARFFADRGPLDHLFLYRYPLAARPPLLNVLTAFYFNFTGVQFGVFQLLMVLTASLVFWPLVLLQQTLPRPLESLSTTPATPNPVWVAIGLLALPSVVQQSTFLWTKVQTAFFVLLAVVLLFETHRIPQRRRWIWLILAAAGLCHFSAAPWILAMGCAVLATSPGALRNFTPRAVARDAWPALLLGLSWFSWSTANLGFAKTFGSNTSLSPGMELPWSQRLEFMAVNFRGSLLPAPLRGDSMGTVFSSEPISRFRDDFFNLLQNNLPLLAGSTGFALALWMLLRHRALFRGAQLCFGFILIGLVVFLGIATHSTPNPDGVANISLLPLALFAVAWNAAYATSSIAPRCILIVGAAFDFAVGILLHFGIQSLWLIRLAYPDLNDIQRIQLIGQPAWVNLQYALLFETPFVSNLPAATYVAAGLGVFSVLALLIAARMDAPQDRIAARTSSI